MAETGVEEGATVELAETTNYRETFFSTYPELEGEVIVHHAVEQQALKRYPGVFTEAEIHSLENLRGIPKAINSDVHLSQIRKIWNKVYKAFPNATREQVLQKITEIDKQFGTQFLPQIHH